MKLKKVVSSITALTMTAALLAGCGGSTGNTEQAPAPEADNTASQTEQEAPKQEETKADAEKIGRAHV